MKIGLLSLGCPKNLVDSEVMLGLAEQAGHELTRVAGDADVLVVNTCAFIDSAKQESVDAILEMAEFKKSGRCKTLVVAGCLAERYREELQREIPEIDVVLGTSDVPRIVEALGWGGVDGATPSTAGAGEATPSTAGAGGATPDGPLVGVARAAEHGGPQPHAVAVSLRRRSGEVVKVAARHREAAAARDLPTYLYDATTPRTLTTPRHYAYVKVAEGCDYNCAFCIIPTLRGQYRSRTEASVVAEARTLVARGVKELLLISQDTTFYGIDRAERGALARLLRALDEVEGLEWVRLLYLYPTTVTDEVLDAMAASSKVVNYIDLPLQHSAASMLARMRRPGTRASYERLLARIRERVPGVALRTTFIVGFPGETAAEFEDLCDFVRTAGFDHVGVFTYSHEEGTAAFGMVDDVPSAEKRRRQHRLMSLQKRIVARRQRARIGERVRLMVDGASPEHDLVWQGRLAGQAPDIDPVVVLTDCDPTELTPGQLIDVEIVGARDYDLVARPLSGDPAVC